MNSRYFHAHDFFQSTDLKALLGESSTPAISDPDSPSQRQEQSRSPASVNRAEQYITAFNANTELAPSTWFEADTPIEQLNRLDNLTYSGDIATAMLESGETLWTHLGWWRDVVEQFTTWAESGQLVRIKLTAQWLLSTLPPSPPDPDTRTFLEHLAAGHLLQVLPPVASRWPAPPEFYLSRLDWAMWEPAEFSEMSTVADVKTAIAIKYRHAA